MNRTLWLSRLLATCGVLESLVGVGLLVVPAVIVSLLVDAQLTDAGLFVARLAGGALLALGIACWFSRTAASSPAGRGVAGALLVYNIIACVLLGLVRLAPNTPILQLAAAALHGLLAAGLLIALLS
jgi:uncharacterized membrane protein (DUF4010 family)